MAGGSGVNHPPLSSPYLSSSHPSLPSIVPLHLASSDMPCDASFDLQPACRRLCPDSPGPSRAKQLSCLQASIRLIESGKAVMGATGEWVRLGGSSRRSGEPAMEITIGHEAKEPSREHQTTSAT